MDSAFSAGRVALLAAGTLFLLGAVFFPVARLAQHLAGVDPDQAALGLTILRLCFFADAAAFTAAALVPAGFLAGRGFAPEVTGFVVARPGEGPDSARAPDARRRMRLLFLLGLTLVGGVLRAIGLGRDLWLDEIMTVVQYLRLPPWQVLYTYHDPNQHMLNSLLGSVSFALFGESAWSARLPAMLLGTAAIPALFFLARALTTEREAWFATALLAVSYHHVWFSQDSRGYAGMVLGGVLGTAFLLRGLTDNRARNWVGYTLTMTLGITSVPTTLFLLLGHLTALFLVLPRQEGWGDRARGAALRALLSMGLVLLLSLHLQALVIPGFFRFMHEVDRTGMGAAVTSLRDFLGVLAHGLAAGARGAAALAGLAAGALVVGAGWLSYGRQSPFFASLVILAPLWGFAAILLSGYGAFPRSFLYVLPFLLLMAVRGAFVLGRSIVLRVPSLRRRRRAGLRLGLAMNALLLLGSLLTLTANYRHPKQDWQGAWQWVNDRRRPGDVVAAVGEAAKVYRKYYGYDVVWARSATQLESLVHAAGRARAGPGAREVWVLVTFPDALRLHEPEVYALLEHEFEADRVFPGTVGDGDLYVMRAAP